MSSLPPTPAKVGHCLACNRPNASFSKSQWKKKDLRRCIDCISTASGASSLQQDGSNEAALGESKKASKPSLPGSDSEAEGNWSPESAKPSPHKDTKPKHKPIKESIRDRMKRSRQDALTSNKRAKHNQNESDDEEHNNISVEKLKQQILGRSIHSYDVNTESQNFNESQIVMDPSVFADGLTVAEHLKPHLLCPVCFERLYNPVSLLCGHSFCKKCLLWWIHRSNKSDDNDAALQVFGTCPSCRHPIVGDKEDNLFQVNTALKACMDALYGAEMNQRRLAEYRDERKATSGENDGAHQRGCEQIVTLTKEDEIAWGRNGLKDEENGWVSLFASLESRHRGPTVYIRRNIILDDCDQRYQISLAFTKCVISKGSNGCIVDLELCLLGMEEDEIDDSGFPMLVTEGSDDEALICTSNDRIHTCIESCARVAPARVFEKYNNFSCFTDQSLESEVKEVPLSRGMIGADGSVRFRIDLGRELENEANDDENPITDPRLVKLIFCHVDTGAKLEVRIPSKIEDNASNADANSDEEAEFASTMKKRVRNKASKFVIDAYEEEEEDDDEPNEYDMDGFVVDDSDDEDGCHICKHGGDLIVCDSGDNEGGCGKSFHIDCINRSEVPPGEIYNLVCIVIMK